MGSRRLRLADVDLEPSTSGVPDWTKCCICGKYTDETLVCPALHKAKSLIGVGYKRLSENLLEFQRIGVVPLGLDLQKLNDGDGIENTLRKNKARWHKKCILKFNKTELDRAKKRKCSSLPNMPFIDNPHNPSEMYDKKPRFSRSSTHSIQMKDELCFICKQNESIRRPLFKIASLQDDKLKRCADVSNNTELKAFLEGGDLVAKEAKYHSKCYTNLTNCLRTPSAINTARVNSTCESMAFATVARFIRKKLQTTKSNSKPVFKMTQLKTIYMNSLTNLLEMEKEDPPSVHTSRLRERILDHFPELKAQLSGKEYFLYRDGANVFQDLNYENLDDDAVACERFINQIRKDITQRNVTFDGHLNESRQAASVPPALLALVNSILYGYASTENIMKATQPSLTISQLIVFNHCKRIPTGNIIRHKKNHEPPFPLYMGLSVYGRTRNNTIIDIMHERGISISPNRILEITASLGDLVVQRAQEEGILCPSNLVHGLFVIGAYDNIDHNFTSTSSESSFHGTSISVFQIPAKGDVGEVRKLSSNISWVDDSNRKISELPESYSVVKALALPSKQPPVPKANENTCALMSTSAIVCEWRKEQEWLDHILTDRKDGPLDLSWAAFHASRENTSSIELSLSSLLPLFNETSYSPSMLRHAMDQIRKVTTFLNPGQIPVICVDQPLFALTKSIQWNWPDFYGESKFVVMFAPFHIEQAFLKVIGQILQGSGWTGVVANSGIKTEAGAEATLKVIHVTKARAIHQITAAVLYSLLKDAFKQEKPDVSFEEWIEEKRSIYPTFRFWILVLNLEILLLSFVRSIRQGNYELFILTLKRMTPWFFLMDHYHYARWLPVHIKDLEELKHTVPDVHKYFCNGQFVIHKTKNPFSALAMDQAHEQNNAVIKGDGGAVGLLQDPAMLRRWMLAGPELVSIIQEFETQSKTKSTDRGIHHEQYASYQSKFQDKKQALKESFLEFGNPFEISSSDLIVWDSKIVMDTDRVKTLVDSEERALELYSNYVNERLSKDATISIFAPLCKPGTKIFGSARKKISSPKMSDLRNDIDLFSRAFIVSQNRDLDLDKFFEYENTSAPPSLSCNGVLRACQKSQLTKILENTIDPPHFEGSCDAIIYDGAALVHALQPKISRTFEEYCRIEFKNRIQNDVDRFHAKRVHISWDSYSTLCLKKFVREMRGFGIRRQVAQENMLPKNWNDFLSCNENKTELFKLLAEEALSKFNWTHVTTEIDGIIRSNKLEETSIDGVECRLQEEADGRIFLHAKDSVEHGAKKLLIFTVDTDVLVLATSFFKSLRNAGLQELWILFGNGRFQRYIGINDIFESIGEDKALALRGFHAFTGSDVTSSFTMKGKQTAWNTWKSFPEATKAFHALSVPQESITDETFAILEKFVVLLYYKEGENYSINRVRKLIFTSKNRNLQNLPPTKEALRQHCLRSAYQAGQVWGRACSPEAIIPRPEGWGWTMTEMEWMPVWSSLPSIWEACRELVKCKCVGRCCTRCSCSKAKLPCTLLCSNCSEDQQCSNKYNKRYDSDEDEENV